MRKINGGLKDSGEERHIDAMGKRRKVIVTRHTSNSHHIARIAKLFKENPKGNLELASVQKFFSLCWKFKILFIFIIFY